MVVPRILAFWQFFRTQAVASKSGLSIRDLIAWARFINTVLPAMHPLMAYVHGAHLILLDGIGLGTGMQMEVALYSPLLSLKKVCRVLCLHILMRCLSLPFCQIWIAPSKVFLSIALQC